MTDKVVFRAWRAGGDVIALFPRIPGDNAGYLCNAYEHVGQHGAADWDVVLRRTRPARRTEYRELAGELRALGYRLKVGRRGTAGDRAARARAARGDWTDN